MKGAAVPGPSRLQMLRDLPRIRRSLPDYLLALNRRYGSTVRLPLLSQTFLIADPADVRHVLVTNARAYHKTGGLTIGRELLGQGLVSSEPPLHTAQRRTMNPVFHRKAVAGFADLMRDATVAHVSRWEPGTVIDVATEMMTLTLGIVGRALFSVDLAGSSGEIGRTFTTVQRLITRRQRQVPVPLWVPTPANRAYRRGIERIDRFVLGIIEERRRSNGHHADLLALLLASRDESDAPMSTTQLRDEVTTLMIAGHETVANHLTWTFLSIAENARVEARLREEWDRVVGDRPIGLDDLSALPFTENVLLESLRFAPPAWTLARKAVEADRLPSGIEIRTGNELLISQYVSHRNGDIFDDPDRFDADRWTPEFRKRVPQTAYYPFGLGPRYCIGEPFARMEAALLLVTIGRHVRFRMTDAAQAVEREALIVMRPRRGLPMRVEKPGSGPALPTRQPDARDDGETARDASASRSA